MAATANTITTLTNILKVRYPENVVQELCYRQQAILPFLKKIRKAISGKTFSFSIETYRADGSRYQAEGAEMGSPTTAQWIRGTVEPTTVRSRDFLTQETISDTGDDAGALFQAVTRIPHNIARDHAFHIARGCWSAANGALATCGTTSAATLIVLAANSNTRRFHRNQKIDVKDANGDDVTNAGSLIITDLTHTKGAERITVGTTTITTTSSHTVHIEDECYDSGGNVIATYTWNGIPALVGSGNIHGVVVATYPEFISYVGSSTSTLTLAKIQAMVDDIESHFKSPDLVIYTSPEVIIKYADLLIPDIRYKQSELNNMVGGYPTNIWYKGGTIGNIPIVKDNLAPKDELYCLHPKAFRLFTTAWMQWFAMDGSKFHRTANVMEYEALMFSRGNTAIINRLGTGKLTGITI